MSYRDWVEARLLGYTDKQISDFRIRAMMEEMPAHKAETWADVEARLAGVTNG